ncbi:hypothetical protein ACJVC5_15260 [Peredibacter sp. HCB2-198]|uniref:hypothetical protein n=1 Tax=Peredibacter sp. HCB2-198 TaxID=3383025 RepID=UPI0038B665F4
MNKEIKIIAALTTLNILLTGWLLFQYKNAPPMEESVRVRVGQSDRFIAENSNKIEQLKGEISRLQQEIQKLNEGVAHHSQMLQDHEQRLKK